MHNPSIIKTAQQSYDPFKEYAPVQWCTDNKNAQETCMYCIRRNHGVQGTFKLHNLNDAINDDREQMNKIVLEYCINDCNYPIFTVSDLINSPYIFDHEADGNILGEIAERIARRITKYFLKHLSKRGKTGGIFDNRFDPRHREDFIVAHTGEYVLKIQKYPNLIILKHSGKGKFGYENIKELDGFFDYRYMGRHHIIVLESKLERININCQDLLNNLFVPLRQLFPDARFTYVLFTDKSSIYVKSAIKRWRQIKVLPVTIHEMLASEGIGSLFFSFNETREDFERMKEHLITQYRAVKRLNVTLRGKTVISDRELIVFDEGETPHIKLVKNLKTGEWHEIPLRHKRVT